MFSIKKIEIPNSNRFFIKLNYGYRILSVSTENNIPFITVMNDTGNGQTSVGFFRLIENNIILEPQYMKYIDSFQVLDSNRDTIVYFLFVYNMLEEDL